MELNEQYKHNVEDIDGINQDLADLGWNQMNGDSDFEGEEPENGILDQQILFAQEGHFGMFAMRQAKGKGKGHIWQEDDDQGAEDDAHMGEEQPIA
eukprot:7585720-Heterocapsa_arctica.AAC.1